MQQHNYTYQSDFAKKYFSQGIEEGRKEGIALAYRAILRTLLEQRFGALPADALARLDQADADSLDAWVRRVLTAGSLADVFASEPG